MTNIIATIVLVLIVGLAGVYLYKAKKRGVKCIGCPDGCKCGKQDKSCGGNCGGCH